MGNAIGKIVDELLLLFKKNYKRPRLWIVLGLIMFCCILLLPYIDSNFLYFSRMEKRIEIFEKIMELDQEKINSNPLYYDEYQSILSELEQQRERNINSVINKASNQLNIFIVSGKEQGNVLIKFLTGAIWCLIITICIPFMNTFKKRGDKVLAFFLMVFISILVGCFFSVIPIIGTPLANYIGIPILQIVAVFICVNKSNTNKKK